MASVLEMYLDLEEFGGSNRTTAKDLLEEVIANRRARLIETLCFLESGTECNDSVFDAIAFTAAVKDFWVHFNRRPPHKNFEGTLEYRIIAGNDHYWDLKTTITWESCLPICFGALSFHTEILSEHLNGVRINALTGTSMKIIMKESCLKELSLKDVLARDGII